MPNLAQDNNDEKQFRKIILSAIALISVASAQVFGMYGANSDWIDFLTDDNQFRARLDQLGFTLGNDTIKGSFGFRNELGLYGSLLSNPYDADATEHESTSAGVQAGNGFFYDFDPTISMGIGYTSSLISVGVGYNATIGARWNRYNNKTNPKRVEAVAHTPVLVLNALDNNFRMAIPIQVVHLTDKMDGMGKGSVTAVSLDSQFRYYTGMNALPEIRLYLKYGSYSGEITPNNGTKTKEKFAESFGFDFRLYFGAVVEEVELTPFIKLTYDGALGRQHNTTSITALDALDDAATVMGGLSSGSLSSTAFGRGAGNEVWEKSAWNLQLMPTLGLAANSDIVSLYLETSLGLDITQNGSATDKNFKEVYGLGYNVYAEIYITPIKNLEWYFEAEIGDVVVMDSATPTTSKGLGFNGTTGITWYLPAL